MSYGFDKAKKPPVPTAEQPQPRKLDLAGLAAAPLPEVSPVLEQAAIAAGERLGFGSREPGVGSQPTTTTPTEAPAGSRGVARARPSAPMTSLYIKGPVVVLDRFVKYANESQARSYWEALDQLLKAQEK